MFMVHLGSRKHKLCNDQKLFVANINIFVLPIILIIKRYFVKKFRIRLKIPLTPMGVLAPGSAYAGPSAQPPINTSGNLSAQGSAE